MLIYLIVFIISYLFMRTAWKRMNTSCVFVILSGLTVLFPSLLAGFRDTTVGHDIEVYMTPLFYSLSDTEKINNVVLYVTQSELEPAFVLFNYFITRFTDNIFWAFFIQQFVVLGMIYYTCYRLRYRINAPVYFLIYLLSMYCGSLTFARQIFAFAMVIFSYPFIIERKWKPFLLCIAIAYFMHKSAVLAIFLYPLSAYCNNKNRHLSLIKILLIFTVGYLFYLFFPSIINFMISHGILPLKYTKYTEDSFNTHKISIAIIVLCFICSKINKQMKSVNMEIQLLSILVFFMLLCGAYNDVAQRVAHYYEYFLYVRILMILHTCPISTERKYTTLVMLVSLVTFMYLAEFYGFAEAIPYTSRTLGIY